MPHETWLGDDGEGNGPGIVGSLWRYRLVVLAVTVLAGVVGYLASHRVPVRYEAEAALILRDPGSPDVLGGSSGPIDLKAYIAKQAAIASSGVVLQRAVRILEDGQSVHGVRRSVEVWPSENLAGITIRVSAEDPASAAALANAVGKAYQPVTSERTDAEAEGAIATAAKVRAGLEAELERTRGGDGRLTPPQEALVAETGELKGRQQEIATRAATFRSGVELFERAELPDVPAEPKPTLGALLGALLGLIAAGGWAWWAAARYQRVEAPEDPAAVLGARLLGEVPEFRVEPLGAGELKPAPSMPGVVREAYHFVLASLEHALSTRGGSSVVVASAGPGDGKTWTVLNLGIAALQEGRRVVLVDADERSRRLSGRTGWHDERRVFNLDGESVVLQEILDRFDRTGGGFVLPAAMLGPQDLSNRDQGDPAAFLRTPAFRKALLSIGEPADLVLIDTPALLGVADAVAAQADGVILVVNRGIPLDQLREVRDRLAFVDTPLLGYVSTAAWPRPLAMPGTTVSPGARKPLGQEVPAFAPCSDRTGGTRRRRTR